MKKRSIFSMILSVCLLASTVAYAADSFTTLSDSASTATGSYIDQGSGNGQLTAKWQKGKSMKAYAMKVKELYPDSAIKNITVSSSNPSNSTSVSLNSSENWYYVKLTSVGGKGAEGIGNFTIICIMLINR